MSSNKCIIRYYDIVWNFRGKQQASDKQSSTVRTRIIKYFNESRTYMRTRQTSPILPRRCNVLALCLYVTNRHRCRQVAEMIFVDLEPSLGDPRWRSHTLRRSFLSQFFLMMKLRGLVSLRYRRIKEVRVSSDQRVGKGRLSPIRFAILDRRMLECKCIIA